MGSPPVQSRGEGITGAVRRRAHRAWLHCDDFLCCRSVAGPRSPLGCLHVSRGKDAASGGPAVVNDALNVLHLT